MTTAHFPSGGKAQNRPLQDTGMGSLVSAMRGAAAPTALTLVAPDDDSAASEALAQLLAQLLPNVALTVQSEAKRGDALPEPAIVLTTDPVLALARRIDDGTAPDQALAAWRNDAQALLAAHRRNRQQVLLVNPAILGPTMAPALNTLTDRLRKIWPNAAATAPAAPKAQQAPAAAPEADAIVLAIALLGDASVADLVQELKAVTFGATQTSETQRTAQAAWESITRTRTRAALLHDQLELQSAQGKLDSPRLQEVTTLYETERARAKVERERLLTANRSLEKRRAHAQARIDALLASSSWRITKPLRAFKRLSPFKRNDH